jgi:hypothetical protein
MGRSAVEYCHPEDAPADDAEDGDEVDEALRGPGLESSALQPICDKYAQDINFIVNGDVRSMIGLRGFPKVTAGALGSGETAKSSALSAAVPASPK